MNEPTKEVEKYVRDGKKGTQMGVVSCKVKETSFNNIVNTAKYCGEIK